MTDKAADRELMDAEHQKAFRTIEAERIRGSLEDSLWYFARDVAYDTGAGFPENYGPHLQETIKRLLDRMFHICPPEAWEMIGKPVMSKHLAEQTHNFMMSQLVMEALTKPVEIPKYIQDALGRVADYAHNAHPEGTLSEPVTTDGAEDPANAPK